MRILPWFNDSYLGEFVYGAIDGSVTTFAVVAGAAGANLSPSVALILGVANLFADGVRDAFDPRVRVGAVLAGA